MVKVVAKAYHALPCSLEVFTINGENAYTDDFGDSYDDSPEDAEPYGCGCHVFKGKMPTTEVLNKYGISLSEYSEIVTILETELFVGNCGWCI